MSGVTEILRADGLGRVRVPRERQEQLLDEFERSGLSGAKFAALCGVKYPSFAGWVARRKRGRAAGAGGAASAADGELRWLEAVIGSNDCDRQGVLRLHFPGGGCAEICDARQAALAAELLRALRSAPPPPPPTAPSC
jgi:hypothetical protein